MLEFVNEFFTKLTRTADDKTTVVVGVAISDVGSVYRARACVDA